MSESEVTVCFNSGHPHTTCWIEITHPVGDPPQQLLDELAQVGFLPDDLPMAPPLDGVEIVCLDKPGSALFGGWTKPERQANMRAARRVMRRHGFVQVPHNRLRWQDQL